MKDELDELFTRAVDINGYKRIVGSKILEFKFEPIANRKTMQFLHIKTDTVSLKIMTKLGDNEKFVSSPLLQ